MFEARDIGCALEKAPGIGDFLRVKVIARGRAKADSQGLKQEIPCRDRVVKRPETLPVEMTVGVDDLLVQHLRYGTRGGHTAD